jgi:hypothetical protein
MTVFQHLVLPGIIALAAGSLSAVAQDSKPAPDKPAPDKPLQDRSLIETTLDIDRDGKTDRAVMVDADLYIYLSAGDEKRDLSRKPSFLKTDLATARVLAVESKGKVTGKAAGKPVLIVKYGCGGCSNDSSTTLTIVYRNGQFVVGGVTYDWDTRSGVGSCDVNFLTGKGIRTEGLNDEKTRRSFRGKFTPVKLADWSDDKRPKACGG